MRLAMKTLVRAIAGRLRVRVVEARIDPIGDRAPMPASVIARPLVGSSPRPDSKARAVAMARPRRGDGGEWPDTQPWCHP